MGRSCNFFLVFLLVAEIYSDPAEELTPYPKCVKELNLNEGKLETVIAEMRSRKLVDNTTVDRNTTCFFECLYKEEGRIDNEGNFNEMVYENLKEDEKTELDRCKTEADMHIDNCDRFFNFTNCFTLSETLFKGPDTVE